MKHAEYEDKILSKNLWECQRFSARILLKELPNKNYVETCKNTANLTHRLTLVVEQSNELFYVFFVLSGSVET